VAPGVRPPQWAVYLQRQPRGPWFRGMTTPDLLWAERWMDRRRADGRDANERPIVAAALVVFAWGRRVPDELGELPEGARVGPVLPPPPAPPTPKRVRPSRRRPA
jgi:hypothetical protein